MYGAVALGALGALGIFGSRKRKERRRQQELAQAAAAVTYQQLGLGPGAIAQDAVAQGYATSVAQRAQPGSFLDQFSSALASFPMPGNQPGPAGQVPGPAIPAELTAPAQEAALIQQQAAPSGVMVAVVAITVVTGLAAILFALSGGKRRRRRR